MEQNMDKAICRCRKVFLADLEEAVNNGASSFEEVVEVTGIGKGCGRCKKQAQEVTEYFIHRK
ncbi:MAG: (2Fe-2S)-binding protein [Clostridiales bacterium]|nr:(2Fe-2S)-binding protein [Clostridiales bacterium]